MLKRTVSAVADPRTRSTNAAPIRTFVVDDSSVVRAFVSRILKAEADIELAGVATDGASAVRQLRTQAVDVVILDVEMPVMDGLTALPHILKAGAHPPKVVMASTLTLRGASISIEAMVKGASDYVPKPTSLGAGGSEVFARDLLDRVRIWGAKAQSERSGRVRSPAAIVTAKRSVVPAPTAGRTATLKGRRPAALAIGSSTGGPQALLKLFTGLRGTKLGPVFLTQHMPPTFTALFAEQLGRASERPCREASDGEAVRDDTIYVAPGDWHLLVEKSAAGPRLRLKQSAPENFCRPAVDPMFRSAAEVFGDRLLAVVLTGMGQDGCAGARVIVDRGGAVIAQDEASSVVWGMPGAVAQAGLATEIVALDVLAGRLNQVYGAVR